MQGGDPQQVLLKCAEERKLHWVKETAKGRAAGNNEAADLARKLSEEYDAFISILKKRAAENA